MPAKFYPMIEQMRFANVRALCSRFSLPPDLIEQEVSQAYQSELSIVTDAIDIWEPEDQIRAVVVIRPNGSVVLFAGLFAELSEDRQAIEARVAKIAAGAAKIPKLKGKLFGVGELVLPHQHH